MIHSAGLLSMRGLAIMAFIIPVVLSSHAIAEDEQDPVCMGKKRSEWIQQLKDEYPENRLHAIKLLRLIGEGSYVACAGLAACLNDDDREIREQAQFAIDRISLSLNKDKFVDAILPVLKGNLKGPKIGKSVSWIKAILGDTAKFADAVLPALKENLKSTDMLLKRESIALIGDLGNSGKSVVPEMVDLYRDNAELAELFTHVIIAIGPDVSIANRAVELLDHTDKRVRLSAIELLNVIAVDAKSAAEEYFAARDAELQSEACKGGIAGLVRKMTDYNNNNRVMVAAMLGRLGGKAKSAIPLLTDALDDENENVRKQAAQSLKRIMESKDYKP